MILLGCIALLGVVAGVCSWWCWDVLFPETYRRTGIGDD